MDPTRCPSVYLDTNIFIPFIESPASRYPLLFELMKRIEQGKVRAVTSDLTFGELLVWPYSQDEALADAYLELLNDSMTLNIVPVDRETILRAARLRSIRKGLMLPDAIHLATAEIHDCLYVISEDKDLSPRSPRVRVGLTDPELARLVGQDL